MAADSSKLRQRLPSVELQLAWNPIRKCSAHIRAEILERLPQAPRWLEQQAPPTEATGLLEAPVQPVPIADADAVGDEDSVVAPIAGAPADDGAVADDHPVSVPRIRRGADAPPIRASDAVVPDELSELDSFLLLHGISHPWPEARAVCSLAKRPRLDASPIPPSAEQPAQTTTRHLQRLRIVSTVRQPTHRARCRPLRPPAPHDPLRRTLPR